MAVPQLFQGNPPLNDQQMYLILHLSLFKYALSCLFLLKASLLDCGRTTEGGCYVEAEASGVMRLDAAGKFRPAPEHVASSNALRDT